MSSLATLLRKRRACRQALTEEVFSARLEQMVQAAEERLAMKDAWEGFSTYLWRLGALQAEDCDERDQADGVEALRRPLPG